MKPFYLTILAIVLSISAFAIGPIVAPATLCAGDNVTLSCAGATTGTWSTTSAAVAISPGGLFTALSVPAPTAASISFTDGVSVLTATITILPAAGPIVGPNSVCTYALGIPFSDAAFGGTWSTSNIVIATVESTNGNLYPLGAGTVNIIHQSAFCGSAQKTVTVIASPAVHTFSVTGGGGYCAGGGGVDIGINPSAAGISYQLYMGTTAVGPSMPGTGSALSFGAVTAPGAYYALATEATTGCHNLLANNVNVTVHPLPPAYLVTGGGCYCSGNPYPGVIIVCGGSAPTYSYQLYNSAGAPVGAPVAGTGGPIDFGIITGAGTYSVIATNPVTGCVSAMVGTPTVTVNPPPATTITGPASICVGTTGTLNNAITVGTWFGGTPSIATIDSASGVVTGLSAGTAQLTYSTGTGCEVTYSLTVNAIPPPINGVASFCDGTCTQLSNSTPGGAWSSSSVLIATVNATGILCGMLPGVTNISYTTGSGCTTIKTVTVNQQPSATTGASVVCNNYTLSLSNMTPGGTWSTDNPSVATIGMVTGILFSVSPGTVNVSYTLPTGCSAIHTVTVTSSSISGAAQLCSGTLTQLSTTIAGGTWTSSNYAIAAVGVATGLVSAVTAGTAVITYSSTAGCGNTHTITVLPLPSITGSSSVCDGTTTALSGSPIGGTWSTSNAAIASASATGIISGHSPGVVNISYTLGSGCSTVKSFTVHAMAAVSGATSLCEGSSIALSNTISGGAWTSSTPSVASINPFAPVVYGISGGAAVISYSLPTGCNSMLSLSVQPSAVISGSLSVCNDGSGILLSSSIAGGVWSSASPVIANISFMGVVTGISVGTTNISYIAATGCASIVSFTVHEMPSAIIGTAPMCAGSSLALSNTVAGGAWSVTPSVAATIDAAGNLSGLGAGTALVTYTTPFGCASSGSVSVGALPSVSITVTPSTSFCFGTPATFSVSVTGGTATSQLWYLNGIGIIGATTPTLTITPFPADSVSIETIVTASCNGSSAGYAAHTPVVVHPLPSVSASYVPGCGAAAQLSATGTALTYSWSPAAGLSCSTCANPIAHISSSTTYTVTGTDANGCSDTGIVSLHANRISGYISYTGTATDSFRVWLIRYNPTDSTVTALDSTVSCMDGGTPYYEFASPAAGSYMVKAKLFGTTPGTSGYIPTYGPSSATWATAATLVHSAATDTQHISMIYGTVPTGPGFIAGNVYFGAGKGTTGEAPVEGMVIYLRNTATLTLTYTYTDAAGAYSFNNLAYGDYVIYPEEFEYYTTPSPVITLSAASPSASGVDFKQHTDYGAITPFNTTAVKALAHQNTVTLYPNPAGKELSLQWQGTGTGPAEVLITDITGRIAMQRTLDINTTSGITRLDISKLGTGIYIVSFRCGDVYVTKKISVLK